MIINAKRRDIPALWSLWQQAFGDTDAFLKEFYSCAFSPSRCRCVSIRGTIAAVLYWFDCDWEGKRLAYLYAVATEEIFRGKGLCRALMENTHAHLYHAGYDGCILVPGSEALFGMYEKLGYTTCSYIREFECAAGKPIPLRQLTATEYAALRREYLPTGGVVQEGEALTLLQSQAAFYAGENCLLACAPNGGKLVVSELLGDVSAAPGILATLGYCQGIFRTPGNEKPFAMYHPLTDGQSAPAYFGLALD